MWEILTIFCMLRRAEAAGASGADAAAGLRLQGRRCGRQGLGRQGTAARLPHERRLLRAVTPRTGSARGARWGESGGGDAAPACGHCRELGTLPIYNTVLAEMRARRPHRSLHAALAAKRAGKGGKALDNQRTCRAQWSCSTGNSFGMLWLAGWVRSNKRQGVQMACWPSCAEAVCCVLHEHGLLGLPQVSAALHSEPIASWRHPQCEAVQCVIRLSMPVPWCRCALLKAGCSAGCSQMLSRSY